jgi:hypothetical protein
MAAHKGPGSLRPRCTRSGSSVAAAPIYHLPPTPTKSRCAALLCTWHTTSPSHSSWSDDSNNIRWGTGIMKLLSVKSPPVPCSLFYCRSKYLPQLQFLIHPQHMFMPQFERLNIYTHIKPQVKLQFRIYLCWYIWIANWTTKDSGLNDSRHCLSSIWW